MTAASLATFTAQCRQMRKKERYKSGPSKRCVTHLSLMILGLLLFLPFLLSPSAVLAQTHRDPKLVEGAKRERELIYYTTTTLDQSKQVVDRFEKKYPFIKTTLFRAGSGALVNKILTEASAGRYSWDVMGGGVEKVSRIT